MVQVSLTDFRMVGFLVARGLALAGTAVDERNDVVFYFDDGEGQATALLNQFPGSPEQVYDSSCKTMFDFVRQKQKQRDRGGSRG